MPLDSLPLELICRVASFLQKPKDKFSLLRSNSRLHDKVIHALYKLEPHYVPSVLEWLLEKGSVQGLQHLISRNNFNVALPITPKYRFITRPLLLAIYYGHLNTVEVLLHSEADVNTVTNISALELAATLGNYHITSLLLQHDAHIDLVGGESGLTALECAVNLGYIPEGHESSGTVKRWFHSTVYKDQTEFAAVIQLLLVHGADLNGGYIANCLAQLYLNHKVPWEWKKKMTGLFIEYGVDLKAQNYYGKSILHAALRHTAFAKNGSAQQECVLLLLQSGVDVNQKNGHKEPPFGITIENEEISKFFSGPETSVHCRAINGANIILRLLSASLRKVNRKQNKAKKERINLLMELLVEHGAQPQQSINDNSPLDIFAARLYPVLRDMSREKKLRSAASQIKRRKRTVGPNRLKVSTMPTRIMPPRDCVQGKRGLKRGQETATVASRKYARI